MLLIAAGMRQCVFLVHPTEVTESAGNYRMVGRNWKGMKSFESLFVDSRIKIGACLLVSQHITPSFKFFMYI